MKLCLIVSQVPFITLWAVLNDSDIRFPIDEMIGDSFSPSFVKEYSTFSGTVFSAFLFTTPSASSSLICNVSILFPRIMCKVISAGHAFSFCTASTIPIEPISHIVTSQFKLQKCASLHIQLICKLYYSNGNKNIQRKWFA